MDNTDATPDLGRHVDHLAKIDTSESGSKALLARDTGGTSQRRGVHGDPWNQPISPGAADLARVQASYAVDEQVSGRYGSSSDWTVIPNWEPLFDERVSWPMTLGLWGLAFLVGLIWGAYFFA